MDITIALLVLLSALIHPLWNLLLKKAQDPEGAMITITAVSCLMGLGHALISGADITAILPLWPLVLVSCGGQVLYSFSLVATLKRGDLSAYYPIIRSSPVIIMLLNVVLFAQRYPLSAMVGIALVVIGAFALLYRKGVNFLSDPLTLGWAVLALCGTAIYSLADARLTQSVAPPVMFFAIQLCCLPCYMLIYHRLGHNVPAWCGLANVISTPRLYLTLPLMVYGSYWLILTAFAWGGEVAAVSAVRQASIPFSVMLGGLVLHEGSLLRRLAAAVVLSLGIVLIIFAH